MVKRRPRERTVRWNWEEREKIFQRAKALRQEGPIDILEAARQAQDVLPPDRQRNLSSLARIPRDLIIRLTEAWQTATVTPAPEHVQPPAPQPSTAGLSTVPSDGAAPSKEGVGQGDVAVAGDPLLDMSFNHLCDSLGAYLADRIMQSMLGRLRDRAQDVIVEATTIVQQAAPSPQPKPPVKPKPRVVVVGALGEQARMLEQEFGDALDIRCLDKNVTDFRLRQVAETARKVVLWTNFVGHHHQNNIPRDKLEPVTGGMTKMREKLTEIYANL